MLDNDNILHEKYCCLEEIDMINKIKVIKNVGVFKNFSSPERKRDLDFLKLNLIYAENGLGKTTISAILRSLTTDNNEYILDRKTIGHEENPFVVIQYDNNNYIFEKENWKTSPKKPEIEIFDETFVNDNVYAGDFITPEHRKNLLEFAIGEEGVRLTKNIIESNKEISDKTERMRILKQKIESSIIGIMYFEKFINLEEEDEIGKKIESKKKEIESQKNSDQIKSKSPLSNLNLFSIDFDELDNLLNKTVDSVIKDVEEKVKEHIKRYLDEEGEGWLLKGMDYLNEGIEKCPFCGLPTLGSELIILYRQYFSDEYKVHKNKIIDYVEKIEDIRRDSTRIVSNTYENNKILADYWKNYVSPIYIPEVAISEILNKIESICKTIYKYICVKKKTPLEAITKSNDFMEASTYYKTILKEISSYNISINSINQQINSLKNTIDTGNITKLENELNVLRNREKRFSKEFANICNEYLELEGTKAELEKKKISEKAKLDKYTETFIPRYEKSVNKYLDRFGAGFRIAKVEGGYPGGVARLKYSLTLENGVNDLFPQKTVRKEQEMTFKNSMSSGDKTTLAFAFFVSKLENDEKLNNKVIVFDDPISSLDEWRTQSTAQFIKAFFKISKQVIVLSHDMFFLKSIHDLILNANDNKTFRIERAKIGSKISEWDIVKDTQDKYFEHYNILLEYTKGNSEIGYDEAIKNIRLLLEGNMRYRFPGLLHNVSGLGNMIEKLTKNLNKESFLYPEDFLNELSQINEFCRKNHHYNNSQRKNIRNERQLTTYIKRTLYLVSGYWDNSTLK